MRLYAWNVNGIRAAGRNGLLNWIEKTKPDVLCLQEVKARPEQIEPELQEIKGYGSVWHSARRPGYSGTAAYFKKRQAPADVSALGIPEFDDEGRGQVLTYPDFTLINAYFPNSQPERKRLDYKLRFMEAVRAHVADLLAAGKHVVVCGDFNVSHKEIDLARPKQNRDNPGFYPEECEAMDAFLNGTLVDAFRTFHPDEPGHYTWWSYRGGARARNVGWRLDYHVVDAELMPRVKKSQIHASVMGSDHCPISIELR